mmetsp:Transcript_23423/g.34266  ORF Transcript_23423/g.34266 Transcript_23423/m.34266 type:complete len:153 (+) Transcript_23423:3-461(+)
MPGINMGNMNGNTGAGVGASSGVPPTVPGLDFSSLLNQMQSSSISGMSTMGGTVGGGQAPNVIPNEQRFVIQLQSLNDMGFDDNQVNIAALVATHGNVNRAIDMLLTDPPAPLPTSASPGASAPTSGDGTIAEQENNNDTVEDKDAVEKKND